MREGRGGGASDPAAAPLYRRHAAVGDDRDCPLRAGYKDLKKILRATDGLGTEATRAGIIELLFKRGFLSKKGALYPLFRRPGRALIHSLPGDGRATGHDRPLGVGVDADQRETVPLSGLMQPLVGTLYQLIDQARSTPVRQFRGLVAPGGAKKSFSKGKGKPKGKKAADDTAPPPQ